MHICFGRSALDSFVAGLFRSSMTGLLLLVFKSMHNCMWSPTFLPIIKHAYTMFGFFNLLVKKPSAATILSPVFHCRHQTVYSRLADWDGIVKVRRVDSLHVCFLDLAMLLLYSILHVVMFLLFLVTHYSGF